MCFDALVRRASLLLLVVVAAVAWQSLSGRCAAQSKLATEKIAAKLKQIEATFADPLATEKEIEGLQKVLGELIKDLAPDEEDAERNPDDPRNKLLVQATQLLQAIRGRLLEDEPSPGSGERVSIDLPAFGEGKLVAKIARGLAENQKKLVDHLDKSPTDKKRRGELLAEMVVAQEALAWEAGWPFTADEIAAIKKADGEIPSDVYHSRRGRGINRINQRLQRADEQVGRAANRTFAIHSPEDEEARKNVEKQLAERRGKKAVASWSKGTKEFDEKEELRLKARARGNR